MRKKVIFSHNERDTIELRDVPDDKPIFANRNDILVGMVVCENKGWILRTGGDTGSSGHHKIRLECLQLDSDLGYEFFVEE